MTINKIISNKNKTNKLSKIALLAMPLAFATINTANAGEFPTFTSEDLYLNHITSSVPGSNLVVNPSFGIANCADFEAAVLAQSVECVDGKTWGWDELMQSGGGSLVDNYAPPNVVVDESRRGAVNKDLTVTLSQTLNVANVTDVYLDMYLLLNLKDSDGGVGTVNLVLDNGVRVEVLKTPSEQAEYSIDKYVHTFDAPYTGTLNLEIVNTAANKILIDHIYLSTDQNLLAPSDVDGDGTPDEKDAFVDNSAADTDADLDGLADFFIDASCKEGGVIEGADLAECNGLTLDTDDDNDGDSDEVEIAAGTDPLNADSNALDTDADGWINATSGEISANDNFPSLAYVHQTSLTNGAVDYAVDAEAAVLVEHLGSTANNEWEWWTQNKTTAIAAHEIVDTTDHNGLETKAFKLSIVSGSTAGKRIQIASPLLLPLYNNVKVVRLAGWMKVTGPTPNDTVDAVTIGLKANSANKEIKAKNWSFTAGSADEAIYNKSDTDNQGWHYFEENYQFVAGIEDIQIQLKMKADVEGVEVLFDNLELNFINSGDFDEDSIIDAIDNDDDNDGIKDGLDETPMGDNATDSDGDGILNGYDDDFDGDGIADAFDDTLPTVTVEHTPAVSDNVAQTITISGSATTNVDDAIAYSWTVNDEVVGGDNATLVLNESDYEPGSTLTVRLTASAAGISKSVELSVTTNSLPTISIAVEKSADGVLYTATEADINGDELNIAWYVDDVMVQEGSASYFLSYDDFIGKGLPKVNVYAVVTDVNRASHSAVSDTETVFIPLKAELDQQPDGGSTPIAMLAMLLLGLTRKLSARDKQK